MALYSGYHDAVPTQVLKKDPKTPRPSVSSSQPNPPSDSPSMEQLSSASIADFLGPAVDSPPSPEKLRQLNKQMKRASHLQRHYGHKAASSESSSLSSMNTADRLPWELALDNLSLVRRSSIRSNDSSVPSRDRPESVHNFGKGFFHRRGKSKRESSTQSSSSSSIYSGDMASENNTAGGKEGIIPSLFSRRKPSRDEPTQRRPPISGPFNFQHVTHTQRDNAANNETSASSSETMNETSPTEFEPAQYPLAYNMSLESMGDLYEEGSPSVSSRPPLVPRHTAPVSGPRRLLKHIRSQERLRKNASQPPPRPPRSPIQANGYAPFIPLPPPRISSRQSSYQDITDAINMAAVSRGHTSEFSQPLPFSPATSSENIVDDSGPHGHDSYIQQEQPSPDEKRYSRVVLGARDSTWPLAIPTPMSYEALADVPEEEEHHGHSRRSRLSITSNNSSLRGSQSVPMLRSLAESQRPTSGASETLGGLGIMGLNRIVHEDPQSPVQSGTPTRESWEDLIDYCYEHEAEADCDYQWERPSLDTARDSITPPAKVQVPNGNGLEPMINGMVLTDSQDSPSIIGLDAPSLSPASHRSTLVDHEVVTPSAIANNFSLPRGDRKSIRPLNMKDNSRASGLSTFRESQAFTLSPSLLIPGDFQQQMVLSETDKHAYSDYEFIAGNCHQSAFHEDAIPSVGASKSSPSIGQRSSTSTTETNSTSRSNSTGRQYRSTNSSWTTLARRTASTTSLNKMAGVLTDESEPLPTAQLPESEQDGQEWPVADLVAQDHVAQDHVPDMIPFPPSNGLKRYYHKSHASESQVRDDVPVPVSPVESTKPRRPRARTTSLSAQSPPPVGQYALFPRTHVKTIGDHI